MIRPTLLLLVLGACTDKLLPIDDTGDTDSEQTSALIGILVTPERVTVPLGEEVQLRATGLREDRSTVDLTAVVEWSSNNAAVASLNGSLDQEGIVTGETVGSATIVAGQGAILSTPVNVTVTQAELVGLIVEPASVSLEVGDTVQLRATAAFSDGTRSDAASQVRWITGSGSVATIELGGLLTAVASGSTEVVAEWQGHEATPLPVTVVSSAEPDLVTESVTFDTSGDEVTVTLRFHNAGNVGASDYWADVFIDPETTPQPGDLGNQYFPLFFTDAGATSEVVWTFATTPGPHSLYVLLDSDNEVEESNESNNGSSHDFSLDGQIGGPNLVITYFDYVADADSIFYVIDVANTGGEDVGEFYIDMWVDSEEDPTPSGIGDNYLRIPGLAAGATTSADFLFEDEFCIYCFSWAMVDTNAEVEETDESDNIVGPLEVESPF
jgi:hypothetical protein